MTSGWRCQYDVLDSDGRPLGNVTSGRNWCVKAGQPPDRKSRLDRGWWEGQGRTHARDWDSERYCTSLDRNFIYEIRLDRVASYCISRTSSLLTGSESYCRVAVVPINDLDSRLFFPAVRPALVAALHPTHPGGLTDGRLPNTSFGVSRASSPCLRDPSE